jgi:hypothetical protein
VYETRVQIGGIVYKGITNFGARPTFANDEVWTETYIDGFSGDLYDKELKVEFVRFMREIEKFASVEDLGGGYKYMHTSYSKNDKEKSSKTLIAPDGREIDLGFYTTEGFMLPADKIVHWEPMAGEKSTELLNSSDPKEIKENNDRWVTQQCELASEHMNNPEDLAAFRRLVERSRVNMESEGGLVVGVHQVNGTISDYFAVSGFKEDMKDLKKTYRQIVKEGNKRYRSENLTQKAKANDVSNIASMSHIWNGGMAD